MTVPRQPVGNVTEHRVTLGDFERKELAGYIAGREKDQDLELVLDVVRATAQPVAIAATAYLVYLGLTNFGLGLDVLRDKWRETFIQPAATTVEDLVTSDLFTVEGQADGPGGGGGASQGVFGGSVFM